jgi:iron(III) transport system ATP-binding protein
MTTIALRGLRKSHGPTEVLRGLDLDLPSGALVAVLGPSGCGKTTLLRCLAGLETIQGGEIALDGRTVAARDLHVPPEGRGLAMVFQSYALWPHMSVAQNVGYPLRVAKAAEAEARTSAALEAVRLTPYAARRPAELSGGQQQRTALARALVAEPGLILMDEPLANLDMHLREGMRAEFRRLHAATGATMVLVTHDQADALSLADLVVVMEAGRILQAAPPVEIYGRPATLAVARLIGRSSVVTAARGLWQGAALPGAEGHDGPVLLRPEDVSLAPGPAARVIERVYLGDRWRLVLEVGGERVEAYAPAPPDAHMVEIAVTRAWPLSD